MSRRSDLDRLYRILEDLAQRIGGPYRLDDPRVRRLVPTRGVYFFFEPGEFREDGQTPRVVRVGPHAVSTGSRTSRWQRLAARRGRTGGRPPGGGTHRGPLFRPHVATAPITRAPASAAGALSGAKQRAAYPALREAEPQVEQMLSQHRRSMRWRWVAVDGPPGPGSHRKVIEAGAVALRGNLGKEPIGPPSPNWLGRSASGPATGESGL